jgi:hypothetical protein
MRRSSKLHQPRMPSPPLQSLRLTLVMIARMRMSMNLLYQLRRDRELAAISLNQW